MDNFLEKIILEKIIDEEFINPDMMDDEDFMYDGEGNFILPDMEDFDL